MSEKRVSHTSASQKSAKSVPKAPTGSDRVGSISREADGPSLRRSTRLQGFKATPQKSPQKAKGEKRKTSKKANKRPAEETKAEKRARLTKELEELGEESDSDDRESETDEDIRDALEDEETTRAAEEDEELAYRLELAKARAKLTGERARKQAEGEARGEPEGSPVVEKKERGRRGKLAPPGPYDGSKQSYKAWKRVTLQWRKGCDDVSDGTAGNQLLQALSGIALDVVVGNLGDEELGSYEAIQKVLDAEFGKEELLESVRTEDKLAQEKRKGRELGAFLTSYGAIRAEAIRQGFKPSEETEGNSLLRAAELGPEARADILKTLSLQGEKMTYATVRKVLRAVASSHDLAGDDEGEALSKKEKKVLAAFRKGKGTPGKGPAGKPGQHGKRADGKNKHQQYQVKTEQGKGPEWKAGDWTCPGCGDHQFARNVACRSCQAPKPGETSPGQGSGKPGKGKNALCWFHMQGKCTKGADCKFSHGEGKGKGKGKKA